MEETNMIITFALAGFLGGIIHVIVRSRGVLTLPKVEDGKLYLGFLVSGFLGMITAIVVDGHLLTAFFAAVAVPDVTEGAIRKTREKLNGRGE
jgi:hypothetical protein